VLLPLVLRAGGRPTGPQNIGGQFARGAVHTGRAVPVVHCHSPHHAGGHHGHRLHTPIFIMLGAWLVFREPMRWERWVAALIGFGGVLIVVAPKLSGSGGIYSLVMLASAPVFAASFLITKGLTRTSGPRSSWCGSPSPWLCAACRWRC
jgi:peptidoglycan/LPS O-acetylase OafA/YrhL